MSLRGTLAGIPLMQILNSISPPFADANRTRPRDMHYVAHEKPPLSTSLVTGAQHALVMLMVCIYVVIVGEKLGLSDAQIRGLLSLQIVVLGVTTLIQGLHTRISSGHLLVHTPSIISSSVFVAVVGTYGYGAASGALIVSGIVVMALSRFLPKLQKIFPPEVTGVLLVVLGIELIKGGISRFVGLEQGYLSIRSICVASVTLGGIVALSIWGGAKLRIFAVGVGVLAGVILAAFTSMFGTEELKVVAAQPFVSLPLAGYRPSLPTLVPAAILSLLMIEVISAVDSFGIAVAADKLNDVKWRRPDMNMVGRAVGCHGLGVFLNGLAGTLSSGLSSANLGLAHATGVSSRWVGIMAGIFLMVASGLPKLLAFIAQLPQPIRGAILVYTAGYMLVSGMQLAMSRMLNNRRMFMIGLSICVGGAVILIPELTAHAPAGMKPVLGSGLTMGCLTAIVLNLVFTIGVKKTEQIAISGNAAGGQAARFLEDCGAEWGARHDVIAKAGLAIGEAMEALHEAKLIEGPAILTATFDEYTLILTLTYPGKPFDFEPGEPIDLQSFLESEEGDTNIDAVMSRMSGHLISNLADRVTSRVKGNQSELRMNFAH